MVVILILGILFANVAGDNELLQINGGTKVNQNQPDCPNTAILLRILNILTDSLSLNGSNNIDTNRLMYVLELIKNYFESSPRNFVDGELYRVFNNIKNLLSNSNVSSNKNHLRDSVEEKDKIKITVHYELPASLNCHDSFEYLFKLINEINQKNVPGLTNLKIISGKPKNYFIPQTPYYDKMIQDKLRKEQISLINFNNLQHNKGNNIMSILQHYRPQALQIAEVDYGKNNEEQLHPNKAQQLPYTLNLMKGFINDVQLQKPHEDSFSMRNISPGYEMGELQSNTNYNPAPEYQQNTHINAHIYQVPPNYKVNAPKSNEEKYGNMTEALVWKYPNVKTQYNIPYTISENLINYAQSPYISNPNVLISADLSNSIPPIPKQSQLNNPNLNIEEAKYSGYHHEQLPSIPISLKKLNLATKLVKIKPDTSNNQKLSNFGSLIYNYNQNPTNYQPHQDLNNQNEPDVSKAQLNNDYHPQPYQDPNNRNQNAPNVFGSHLSNENIQSQVIVTSNILPVQNSRQNPSEFRTESSDKNQPQQASYVLDLPNSQHLNSETNYLNLKKTPDNDHIVEITYVLQRPKRIQYEPLYLVKYRLPLKIYEDSLNKLLTQKPHLRNNSNQLYQELLSTTNFTKSSNAEIGLKNKEIVNMVSKNGTFVGTKFLRSNGTAIESELNIIKEINSNLSSEDVLNINNGTAEKELERLKHSPVNDTKNKEIEGQTNDEKELSVQGLRTMYQYTNPYKNYINRYVQSPMNMNNVYKSLAYKNKALHPIPTLDLTSYFNKIKMRQPKPILKPTLIYGR